MKVVCIDNIELGRDSQGKPRNRILSITPGKTYETNGLSTFTHNDNDDEYYTLLKDNERELITYPSRYFVTLEEWREMQLKKIL